MVKKQNKKILIIISIIVLGITIIIFSLLNVNKNQKLDELQNNNVVNHNVFALMLETDINSNTYEESSSDIWPDGYTLNKLKSECLDKDGNKIVKENILKFDEANKTAIVETDETCYCYLYFDKSNGKFNGGTAKDLVNSNQAGLEKSFDGDELEYRFVGKSNEVNNYICISTKSSADCVLEKEKYMYRIIGITGDNLIKVIKAYPYDMGGTKSFKWHNNAEVEEVIWGLGGTSNAADIADMLNGGFLNEQEYGGLRDYHNYFEEMNWNQGLVKSIIDVAYNSFGEDVYYQESMIKTTGDLIVGLPYLSDFYLAAGVTSLYQTNNWMLETLTNAWTMTRYGREIQNIYDVWFVENKDNIFKIEVTNRGNIYPVVYLNKFVEIIDGEGTASHPFIVQLNSIVDE